MFLTDQGMSPRSIVLAESRAPYAFSLYFLNGSWVYTVFLFLITACSAIALLLGYYTRIATCVSWVMIASLNIRAPHLTYTADQLLAVLLFWGMFLPLGACFSIDKALAREQSGVRSYIGLPGLAILLQHSYLYSFGAALKSSVFGWQHYTAIEEVMHMIHYRSVYADYLLSFPQLMKCLSIFVYYIECATIFIVFFPFYNAVMRIGLIALLLCMHIGFWLFLYIGYFPLISIAGLSLFLPPLFWEKAATILNFKKKHVSIYYDGDCEFCKKTCLLLRELSFVHYATITAAQDIPEMHAILRKENSWIVKNEHGALLLRFDGVVYFWLRSPLFWPLGLLFTLPYMHHAGNTLYLLIAKHRGFLGKITAKIFPYHQHAVSTPWKISRYIVAICASITFYTNVKNIPYYSKLTYPTVFKSVMDITQLSQNWGMFTSKDYYSMWVASEGVLTNGQIVDILYNRNSPPISRSPINGSEVFQGSRWEIPFLFYDWKKNGYLYGMAKCREWNQPGDAKILKHVKVTLYRQYISHTNAAQPMPLETHVLVNYSCW